MKTALTIASVLTWFNIIFWGGFVALGLLGGLVMGQLIILAPVVLLSAIPLNCYAALKLQTSIRYPNVALSHQTPVGIRFVGLMAMFIGVMLVFQSFTLFGDPKPGVESIQQVLDQLPKPRPVVSAKAMLYIVRLIAAGILVLGLAVAVNVILNLRLLRWYYLVHRSDAS